MEIANPVLVAVGIYLLYLVVVAAIWKINKVAYLTIGESAQSAMRGIVVPIGVGLLMLVIATTLLGWWGDVLTQSRQGPAWAMVVPVMMAAVAVLNAVRVDYRHPKARSVLPVLAVGVLLVGAAEELLTRGLLVVAPQQQGWSLLQVWLLSTALFSLLHAINVAFGVPLAGGALQLVMTFLAGTALFLTLFLTGSLVVAALVHALWDYGTFGRTITDRAPQGIELALPFVVQLAAIITIWFVVL